MSLRSCTPWMSAVLAAGCGRGEPQASAAQPGPGSEVGGAPPAIQLISPLPAGEWTLPAGDLANTRYSPLDQITPRNAGQLHLVATHATGVPHGHAGGPLVVGSTMYVVAPFPNDLIAIDLGKPGFPIQWRFEPHPDPDALGKACCDVVNRGASYAHGKIIYNLLDAHTVAVDAATGQQVWRTQVGEIDRGETTTMAPLVVKEEVIVGNSGGELGARGKVVALDVDTGKQRWVAYSTGPDADVQIGSDFHPFYRKDQGTDLGIKSFPPGQWKLGGGTVGGWISYDPEQNLIFYGTGNPGGWNPDLRAGDNQWACSILARDADTGAARWAYQIVPHDPHDYDEIMENVLVDMAWGGRMRKLLIHPGRTGFLLVLDRTTGELLAADKFMPSTNWATGYDLATGEPEEDPARRTRTGARVADVCPSSTGANELAPSALSPRTGLLYLSAHNTCMEEAGMEVRYIAGTPYLEGDVRRKPGPMSAGDPGQFLAWDVAHRRVAWKIQDGELPDDSGALATGGDVVFYGTMDGWFKAVDARSGAELWKQHLASGIIGNPTTFLGPDGKQYVVIYAGIGDGMGASALPAVSQDDPYAALGAHGAMIGNQRNTGPGGVVYLFSL